MGGRASHPALKCLLGACAAVVACAPATRYHMPSSVRGYAVYVPRSDSLSLALAQAFRRRGVVVLDRLRGSGGPTAALIHFTFRDVPPTTGTSLHVQLADTRTGTVVAAAAVTLDSLPEGRGVVDMILDSLGLSSSPRSEP
jgi:hypothetical protein